MGPDRQKWRWSKSGVSSELLNKTQDTNYCITLLSENTSYVYECYAHKQWGYLVRSGFMSAFRKVWMNSTWHTKHQEAMNTSRIFTYHVYCLYYFQATVVCYKAISSHPLEKKKCVCAKYCICVMPGSNLGRDTEYPEYFSWTFSFPLQVNSGIVPTMRLCLLLSTCFKIHFHHMFIWGLYFTSSMAYTAMKYKQRRSNSISDNARLVTIHQLMQHNIPEALNLRLWLWYTTLRNIHSLDFTDMPILFYFKHGAINKVQRVD
jgi:hypothetical protein